jgi:hypothetical protein
LTFADNIRQKESFMDTEELLTKEKADALFQRIAKGIEENKFSRSVDIIDYAMKEAWLAAPVSRSGFDGDRRV